MNRYNSAQSLREEQHMSMDFHFIKKGNLLMTPSCLFSMVTTATGWNFPRSTAHHGRVFTLLVCEQEPSNAFVDSPPSTAKEASQEPWVVCWKAVLFSARFVYTAEIFTHSYWGTDGTWALLVWNVRRYTYMWFIKKGTWPYRVYPIKLPATISCLLVYIFFNQNNNSLKNLNKQCITHDQRDYQIKECCWDWY